MLKGNIVRLTAGCLALLFLFSACRKREGFSLPDNYIVFTTDAQGLPEAESSIQVKVRLSRGTDKEIPLVIKVTEEGAAYGTKYTTTPAVAAGQIALTIPQGNNEASFTLKKVPGVLFDGTEKLTFELYSSGSPVLIGTTKKFTLTFAELVATNSAYVIDGGGTSLSNKVFIDLSANRQTPVLRTNWDFGFYSGDASDFKVILNATTGMMAKQVNKNDLAAVTAADTLGFSAIVAYSSFAPDPSQLPFVDFPDGDLNKTAIGLVAATASDNKVYIVNRGFTGIGTSSPAKGWKKIRVVRNASGGYTLQHADIASTTFTSIDIPKDNKYFFKYVSLENGIVPVEPEKTKWDIAWNYSGFVSNFGAGDAPYLFQDIIFQNRNVQVAKVMTSAKTYADFAEADIAAQTFLSSAMAIGSDWRSTQPLGVRTDRYYIIKDGNNNYYKLKFTGIADGGVRGKPSIEYALVKRGG